MANLPLPQCKKRAARIAYFTGIFGDFLGKMRLRTGEFPRAFLALRAYTYPMLQLQPAGLVDEALLLSLASAFHEEDGHPLAATGPAAIRALLAGSPLGRIYVLREQNEPVGYCALCFTMSLEFGGQVVILDDLYLKPAFRNRGLGKQALAQVEAIARGLGAVQIFLEVEDANTGALRLYERQGFSVRRRHMMEKHL